MKSLDTFIYELNNLVSKYQKEHTISEAYIAIIISEILSKKIREIAIK